MIVKSIVDYSQRNLVLCKAKVDAVYRGKARR